MGAVGKTSGEDCGGENRWRSLLNQIEGRGADGPVFGWGVCWLVRFIIGGENVGAVSASGPLGVW
jgi:hypothetical protein